MIKCIHLWKGLMIVTLTYLPNYHFMLILSQENACVESGFSMNEQILEANMKEHSSVARRIVYGRIRGRWYSESGYKDENAR